MGICKRVCLGTREVFENDYLGFGHVDVKKILRAEQLQNIKPVL